MAFTAYFAKFSKRVSAFIKVDVDGASPQLKRREVTLSASAPLVVQNASKYLQHVCSTTSGEKVVGVYVTFAVAPAQAGGTTTLSVRRCATDGTTFTTIVTAASILTGYTAFIPVAQTLAATNPTSITAGESIVVTVTASNDAVGTADVGATVTLLLEPIEDTTISESQT